MASFRSWSVVLVALAGAGSIGCVSKAKLEQCQQELATCTEQRQVLEESVDMWRQRFDREALRWDSVEASITDTLPRQLSELHAERERIVELVPEQVKHEVEGYLDEYFATVMGGLTALKEDNDEIRQELAATRRQLESAGQQLDSVSADTQSIRTLGSSIDQQLREERQRREAIARGIADIADLITTFDQEKINCRDCPDRLRLNRNKREAITAFHQQLLTALADLQVDTR